MIGDKVVLPEEPKKALQDEARTSQIPVRPRITPFLTRDQVREWRILSEIEGWGINKKWTDKGRRIVAQLNPPFIPEKETLVFDVAVYNAYSGDSIRVGQIKYKDRNLQNGFLVATDSRFVFGEHKLKWVEQINYVDIQSVYFEPDTFTIHLTNGGVTSFKMRIPRPSVLGVMAILGGSPVDKAAISQMERQKTAVANNFIAIFSGFLNEIVELNREFEDQFPESPEAILGEEGNNFSTSISEPDPIKAQPDMQSRRDPNDAPEASLNLFHKFKKQSSKQEAGIRQERRNQIIKQILIAVIMVIGSIAFAALIGYGFRGTNRNGYRESQPTAIADQFGTLQAIANLNTAQTEIVLNTLQAKEEFYTKKTQEAVFYLQQPNRIFYIAKFNGAFVISGIDSDGSNLVRLTLGIDVGEMEMSPDGSKIVFVPNTSASSIYTINSDGSNMNRLCDGHSPSWSPDGESIVGYNEQGHYIFTIDENGEEIQILTNFLDDAEGMAWSPDGYRIAFTGYRDHNWGIYIINTDGTDLYELTDGTNPSWSPNGDSIVFTSYQEGNADIYVINADGTNRIRLTFTDAEDSNPDWSPDGEHIAFNSNRDGNFEIYTMQIDGSNQQNITNSPYDDWFPDW